MVKIPIAAGVLVVTLALMTAPATAARISYADTLEPGSSLTVTTRTHGRESFEIVLRIPRTGRAILFLRGRGAPRGGRLIDTSAYACRRSGRYRYCRASYEPLPAGVQRWQVRWLGEDDGLVELTVRW